MAASHDELLELIGVLARRWHQAAERGYGALGLNHTEARLLAMLAGEREATTQDVLSRRISVDRSNAGRAFKRLEREGYVTRSKAGADARTNLVEITPEGRRAAREVARLRRELAGSFFGDLGAEDAATAAGLLRNALR